MTLDGRIEKRIPTAVSVYLVTAEELLFAERAITVNVSPHGARVVSRRNWRTAEKPWLASTTNDIRLQANVVYCEPLADGHFGIGLQFGSAITDWKLT
jgi:hypothetical protein